MIIGNVNTKREAFVQLAVFGENQQRQGIKAIIDTGYTGCLTLPSAIITILGLTWYMQQEQTDERFWWGGKSYWQPLNRNVILHFLMFAPSTH